MAMTTYVIRAKYFGYNDEVFYVTGNRISNVFQDQAEAEAAYQKLEVEGARDFALYEVESLFDADEAMLKQLDEFVFSRCGEHIYQDGEISRDVLPSSLSDADTFSFVQMAEMQKFQLVHFDHEVKFYGLWSTKKQQWLEEHDEFFAGLIYAESPELLKDKIESIFKDYDYSDIELEGSLESLSDQPILLKALIQTDYALSYDEDKQILNIGLWQNEALYAVNALLKQPLFEVKQIELEEIQRLEKELAKMHSYDEDYEYDEE